MSRATPTLQKVQVANPLFDFAACLQIAIERDRLDYTSPPPSPPVSPASLPTFGELDNLGDLSPLTTPESSPESSPVVLATDSLLEPLPPDLSLLTPTKESKPKHSSDKKLSAKPDRRKARQHAAQKAWRKRKRAEKREEVGNHYVARVNAYRKHVQSAGSVKCAWDASKAAVSKTGFVAIREKKRARKQYRLDEVVGERSKHKFRKVEWDGRCVLQKP